MPTSDALNAAASGLPSPDLLSVQPVEVCMSSGSIGLTVFALALAFVLALLLAVWDDNG